jgi:hypothetical protein
MIFRFFIRNKTLSCTAESVLDYVRLNTVNRAHDVGVASQSYELSVRVRFPVGAFLLYANTFVFASLSEWLRRQI